MALLGAHRLTRALVGFHAAVLLVAAAGFWATGLGYQASPTKIIIIVCIWGVWLFHVVQPGRRPADWAIADGLMALGLIVTFTMIASPLQYVAVALKRPLVDQWLSSADLLLGIHAGAIVEWAAARPTLAKVLVFSYHSLLAQFILPILVVGIWYRNRAALWEYIFHFHFCAIVTIVSLAIWPAVCAFAFYGVESLLDQERFVRHFTGLRTGAMLIVDADDMEGLVSIPSFHMAGALMVTWAFRRHRAWLWVLVPLNALMMVSTVMTGAHYFVDVVATVALFMFSVWLYVRSGVVRWHQD